MHSLIPMWIIGGPFVGLLILSFAFKGHSAMGGTAPRQLPRGHDETADASSPILEPMHPNAPRRIV
jgi:hypothetical protein